MGEVGPASPSGLPTVGADPVAFLLVSYGREPQWRPILSGKLLSWGRRPWKSLAFKRLLANP